MWGRNDFQGRCRQSSQILNKYWNQYSLLTSAWFIKNRQIENYRIVYYESIKREIQIRPIYECRCDESLKTKAKEFTRLPYTGLFGGLEHLKIETRSGLNRREFFIIYYESIRREPKIRPIYECRFDEKLQTKAKEFTRLPYTGLLGGLEHLKIETSLIDEKICVKLQPW